MELIGIKAKLEALERLIRIAKSDTEQGRRVASFLLAWWNADTCGGFNITDTWAVDSDIAADMIRVFTYMIHIGSHPDRLGYENDFKEIAHLWRPQQHGIRFALSSLLRSRLRLRSKITP